MMIQSYSRYSVNLFLEFAVVLICVFPTSCMTPCEPKDIPNLGMKLCQLKCHENNLCSNFEYNIETLPCRLSRNDSKKTVKREGSRCLSDVTTRSCPSKTCSLSQRCRETRSGKAVSAPDMKQNYPGRCPQLKADKLGTLHDACRKGDLGRVRRILSRGLVNVNSRDEKHRKTPLMVAVQQGHRRLFAFLLGKGANVSDVDENGDNVLHLACRGGRMGIVDYVVTQYSVDINSKGMHGSTPLLQTVYCGHRDVLKFLVTKGANLSHVDDDGENILHWACRGGHVGVAKDILTQYSVDINSRENHGDTPLMKAASEGHRDVFQFLVRMGANVSHVDDHGDNILHHASIGGHAKMVQHILSQDMVDINSRGKYGRTPLMRAAYHGHKRVFDLLVSKGGLTQLADDQGDNILHMTALGGQVEMTKHILSQDMVDINSRSNTGATPLMRAVFMGYKVVFQFLVKMGANVSYQDDHGNNILHHASIGGHAKMVQHILSQDMVDINSRGKYGRTPLITAAFYGHRKVFDLLVSEGGLTQLADDKGHNILHLAAWGGQVEMTKHILSADMVDINSRSNTGATPLMKAAFMGHKVVFQFLVKMGANVSYVDDHGDNILHHASIGGHAKMVQHILSQDMVDINSRSNTGATPLMKAAFMGHKVVFQFLVKMGASVSYVDDDGDNILHHASIGGHAKMVQHILSQDMVDINSRGKYGRTPLMRAAYFGHRKVFDLLVNNGGLTQLADDEGHNILHLAALGGQVEMTKHILSQDMVDINSRRKNGRTPLITASFYGHRKVFDLLVSKGGLTQLADDEGHNILHLAALGGQVEMTKHILSADMVDINSRSNTGATPLMKAAFMGHKVVFQFLVKMGANVSYVDDHGDNILHHASIGGHAKMVQHILSQDMVDINSRGKYGRTPLMRAAYFGHKRVFDLLVSKGGLTQLADDQGQNILHVASIRGNVMIVKHILSMTMTDIDARDKGGKTAAMIAKRNGKLRLYNYLFRRVGK